MDTHLIQETQAVADGFRGYMFGVNGATPPPKLFPCCRTTTSAIAANESRHVSKRAVGYTKPIGDLLRFFGISENIPKLWNNVVDV